MIYVVRMSCRGDDEHGNGAFTGLTEAESPEEAVEKLQDKIVALHEDEDTDVFDEVVQIYVDDVIELDQVPKDPLALFLQLLPHLLVMVPPPGDLLLLLLYGAVDRL